MARAGMRVLLTALSAMLCQVSDSRTPSLGKLTSRQVTSTKPLPDYRHRPLDI